jgi:hypothetical protein
VLLADLSLAIIETRRELDNHGRAMMANTAIKGACMLMSVILWCLLLMDWHG